MKSDFPYTTAAAVFASAILTPMIMGALKRRFPAKVPEENELEILSIRFDGLEKITYATGLIGFLVSTAIILLKSIEVDSFLVLFGSIGFFPFVTLLIAVPFQRDKAVFEDFIRFQEVKYGFSGRLNLSVCIFLCFLFVPGLVLYLKR